MLNWFKKLINSDFKSGEKTDVKFTGASITSTEFTCECGKHKAWISEGVISDGCPACGRMYKCVYDKKKYNLVVSKVGS